MVFGSAKRLPRNLREPRSAELYAEGDKLPNDEVLSASMVVYVLEKFGVKNIRLIDGGRPVYRAKFPLTWAYPNTPRGNLPSEMDSKIGIDVKTVMYYKDQPGDVLLDAAQKRVRRQ